MELIAIVDENDNFIGEEDKEKCHDGDGILHRAFLVMVFTDKGELLLARRSPSKRLWPGYWDGTVASHVRKNESYEQASVRRLEQELGLVCHSVDYHFKFQYKVAYKDLGTEHEICAVTAIDGVDASRLLPECDEISELRAVKLETLMDEINSSSATSEYVPWLILALQKMQTHSKQRADECICC